ncbi:MAG: UDP-3-O-acyl-N-acetylglucosamine deacetylase [Proteobacteria bacterium]|nr:UDP-3-O-acyl-N-acetylglucosamine deacetylase [Pseudomonadota bacterium]MBU1964791.1 UDP-3-O-acyl-N-acetylglucosamine deacetylase [Pseudomonadota bacterium]MBU4371675.1 UDP-3-O-acyl-N-acetylglucosamine deacetylase [Pseudomonadota bacterium]MBU4583089.1 UDP-3-O-acyl-N-acetylglucosamine deacetylase [Pseudomonadota bacterium]MCG2739270.1 UDP-3-O-acyl-N-acetylglucosamine deacetylase [Syntrophaceae bacterium]
MFLQRTVKNQIACRSVGLHSGRKVGMVIRPADVDEGIVFVRGDLSGNNRIKADVHNVRDTTLATTLGLNGVTVSTVEHLMSAFSGMGVDNAVVEVDAPEVPIMDGSARPFVDLLKDVGTRVQSKGKKLLVIKEKIAVSEGDGTAMFLPSPEFRITYKIAFNHPAIGVQSYHMNLSDISYEEEICEARTFGFLRDVEYLQAKGLALGGSLKNAVVLDEHRIINKDGLRFPDEFVKHKILDAIGDLSLLGIPVIGHFVACKSGHRLNNLLLKELLMRKECWTLVSRFSKEGMLNKLHSLRIPSFQVLDSVPASSPVM